MPLNRDATMAEVKSRWLTPCSDNLIYAYRSNELTGEGGNVNVERERARLRSAGKLPGDGWRPVILPDVTSDGQLIPGLYNNERACFIREDPDGGVIPVPRGLPPELNGKFAIVPFYRCGGSMVQGSATPDGLVDCAHFVSTCLTKGGILVNQPGVPGLVETLHNRKDTRTLGVTVTKEQGERILNSGVMDRGDLITFFHNGGYQHSAFYTGKDFGGTHRISCHTIARFNQFFWNDPWHITSESSWRFTLIHFDEPFKAIVGKPQHCEVKQGGASEVYSFYSNGFVQRSRGTQSTFRPPNANPRDNGYWFDALDGFVFWPVTGQVVKIPVRTDLLGDLASVSSIAIEIDDVSAVMTPF